MWNIQQDFQWEKEKAFNTKDGLMHTRSKDFYQALGVLTGSCLFFIVSKLYFEFFFQNKIRSWEQKAHHTQINRTL